MILDVCTKEVSAILGVVHTVVDIVKLAIPVILVVLATFDLAKVVTNSKGDDSETKKAVKTLITRIIYGIIIFFVPIIIVWVFTTIRIGGISEVMDCYNNATTQEIN
jgi:hypothetical protein